MSRTIANRPVGPIGYGMGSLTVHFKKVPVEDGIAVLKTALEKGANFWNAGEHYGTPEYNSLHLLNAYFTEYPEDADRVVISLKSCFDMSTAGMTTNDKAGVTASIERCLKILDGKCRIDIFQAARLDPNVRVEETVGAIAEYVRTGKLGGIGLSECSAASIRRAVKVHPIAAVEVEVSLFETGIFSNGIAEVCKEFNIPIVAYSPLSRGFLTGQLRKFEDLPKDDYRHMFPRYGADVFDENVKLVDEVEKIANRKGCTIIQVALSWVSAKTKAAGTTIVPIPGATLISKVEENTKYVELSQEELAEIDAVLANIEIKGGRLPARFAHLMEI